MKILRFVLLATLFLIASSVFAQAPGAAIPDDYPTVTALKQAELPVADAVDLAQRFKGVTSVPLPPTTPTTHHVGEVTKFWVANNDKNTEFQISATLRVIGQHIYMWVQSDQDVDVDALQKLADAFDTRVYPNVRELWGDESSPGVDGDPRLYGLFARDLGDGLAAYFSSRNTFPKAVWPTSNEHEMFLFNLDSLENDNLDNSFIESVVAHEFQHMIRFNLDRNEDIWLNEGFSAFTQLLMYEDGGSIPYFLAKPDTQLDDWPPKADTAPHYGASALFVAYFYERFGEAGLRKLSNEPERGLKGFDTALKEMGQPGVDSFFADWALANYLQDTTIDDGRYGHSLLNIGYGAASTTDTALDYPFTYSGTLNQYGTDYHALQGLSDKKTIDIHVDVPSTVPVIPTKAPSGQWMWYSNRGDLSDMKLTRPFDLTGVKSAELDYKVWYDTEQYYDYGYVTVSSDDGKTWHILKTPNSDTTNPVHEAYGPGYTGVSTSWANEKISLNSYAGQKILVRFEFITDDGTTSRGMAIDDVSIPQIGYHSDFEDDDGGWSGEGWIRTDNRLPQKVWVQAVQEVGDTVQVKRWLAPDESDWQLSLEAGATTFIAISPFAPITNIPTDYTLTVND